MSQLSRLSAASAAAFLLVSVTAQAAPSECSTRIDGEPVTIFYNSAEPSYSSWRERYFNRARTCPGAVVITYLMPDLTAEEREVFCANYDPASGSHSMPAYGRRDAFGRCAEPSKTCTLVNSTKNEALELVGLGRDAESGTLRTRLTSTLSAVTHSSGAMILSGNGAALFSAVGQTSTAIGTALASPAILAGAAASVVVIGGAVYLCADED
ncbi:MAG: hypothetical protein ACK4NW_09060 [Roseinatronobacter sp.]